MKTMTRELISGTSKDGVGYIWNSIRNWKGSDTAVFVHGMCGSMVQFLRWLEVCALWEIPAYAIDLRGGKALEDCSLELYEQNILGFVFGIECERVSLIGHSMGAPLCMNVSWQCPNVKTMISLMSAPLAGMLPTFAILHRILRWQYLQAICGNSPFSLHSDDAEFFLRGADSNNHTMFRPESGRVVRELIRGIRVRREIPCRHYLFSGTWDAAAPPRQQKRIAARLGLSEWDIFQIACGHMPMLEEKADRHLEFILSASSFLSRLP